MGDATERKKASKKITKKVQINCPRERKYLKV